jgi:hypothetical protein
MGIGSARLVLVEWPWAWSSLRNLKFDIQRHFRLRCVTPGRRPRVDSGAGPRVLFKTETASSQTHFVADAEFQT